MYLVSNEYIEQISSGIISDKEIFGTITLINGETIELTNSTLGNSSLKINNACDNGSDICIGSAYVGELKLDIFSDVNRYLFNTAQAGAVIKLNYRLGKQIIPLGVFNVYECTRTGSRLSIAAYDNMCKLNKSISTSNVNGSVISIIDWISKKCGIGFDTTQINTFANNNVICNISGENFGSYLDVLSEVCELMACFAYAGRDGKIVLKKYSTESSFTITPKMRKNTKPNDYDVYYTELVEKDVNNIKWTAVEGDGSGLTYSIDNVLITGSESTKEEMVKNILKILKDIYYTPCELGILFNPIFDLGDLVTVQADGVIIKEDINILITSFNYVFNGTSTLSSIGSNRFLMNYSDTNSTSTSSSLSSLKYKGTYIATYEGIDKYTIDTSEKIISSIDYCIGTSNKVSLSGACQIDVTTAGTVEITYFMNGEADSFSTKQYLSVGSHTLNFSCWFNIEEEMQDAFSTFEIGIKSEDLTGEILQGKIKTYILASSSSDGMWKANNVFEDTIGYYDYKDNSIILGWEAENEE